MKLYNTLSKQIEDINPQNPPEVTVYTCGPTVYDYAHVGHWYNYVRMDTLIRTLRASGLKPKWVLNITDVGHLVSDADEGEDKLQKGAKREGKSAWEIAEFYTNDFLHGMKALNMLQPDYIVKATDHIEDQIALIKQLEVKGYTYVIDDGVYYDTSKFQGYAAFAGLDLDEQQAGGRVNVNVQKRQAADFALWKISPPGIQRDMEWPSPWGKGFPGWHIECSAMSMKYLGETIDIHTGGIDHIQVHHTNEIAQSEAVTGKRFAQVWMHGNHVTVNGQKISKSLQNGIKLTEITERGISIDVLRLHILESHYSSQSKFSWDSLEAARNRLGELQALAALRWQTKPVTHGESTFSLEDVPTEILNFLQNNLSTPQALSYLSHVTAQLLAVLIEDDMLKHFEVLLRGLDDLLGLRLMEVADINQEQKQILLDREAARAAQQWSKADELRDQLSGHGIGLRDTSEGAIWFPL